ncbi:hypothetical protein [uncultured Lutibacter sp.]|uniref:hypothetical protein n=1 Tax=uncultured Lutibacter sp. TaxID=437739 RepID=UPI002615B95E|nr:hypothetical protein [uncultured Lutibacter sp.]
MDLTKQYNLRKLAIKKGFNLVPSLEFKNVSDYDYYIWMCKLQKWLRDTHNLHIELSVDIFDNLETMCFRGFHIIQMNDYKDLFNTNEVFKTYEEVLERGLFEALKLINK